MLYLAFICRLRRSGGGTGWVLPEPGGLGVTCGGAIGLCL